MWHQFLALNQFRISYVYIYIIYQIQQELPSESYWWLRGIGRKNMSRIKWEIVKNLIHVCRINKYYFYYFVFITIYICIIITNTSRARMVRAMQVGDACRFVCNISKFNHCFLIASSFHIFASLCNIKMPYLAIISCCCFSFLSICHVSYLPHTHIHLFMRYGYPARAKNDGS